MIRYVVYLKYRTELAETAKFLPLYGKELYIDEKLELLTLIDDRIKCCVPMENVVFWRTEEYEQQILTDADIAQLEKFASGKNSK